MRILFAPNSFKGSISARDICARASFLSVAHDVKFMPFSDGGDGVLDVFSASFPSAKIYKVKAKYALGRTKDAPYLILPGGNTCVIESAKVCGLGELKKSELDTVTLKNDVLRKYFPRSYTPKQMQDTIIKLLEQWQKKRQRSQER